MFELGRDSMSFVAVVVRLAIRAEWFANQERSVQYNLRSSSLPSLI